jgi:hypothetical protein
MLKRYNGQSNLTLRLFETIGFFFLGKHIFKNSPIFYAPKPEKRKPYSNYISFVTGIFFFLCRVSISVFYLYPYVNITLSKIMSYINVL